MKTAKESTPAIDYANWIPLLEVAAREVFELMLGCDLSVPETLTDEPDWRASCVAC